MGLNIHALCSYICKQDRLTYCYKSMLVLNAELKSDKCSKFMTACRSQTIKWIQSLLFCWHQLCWVWYKKISYTKYSCYPAEKGCHTCLWVGSAKGTTKTSEGCQRWAKNDGKVFKHAYNIINPPVNNKTLCLFILSAFIILTLLFD